MTKLRHREHEFTTSQHGQQLDHKTPKGCDPVSRDSKSLPDLFTGFPNGIITVKNIDFVILPDRCGRHQSHSMNISHSQVSIRLC